MVPIADLKEISLLDELSDDMLKKLQSLVNVKVFNEGDLVFQENSEANTFYMIKSGKVLLEQSISDTTTISMGSFKAGNSFGWSSMLVHTTYSTAARCSEESVILVLRADDALKLFEDEPKLGYIFMRQMGTLIKNRLGKMEERLMRSLRDHPDFADIL